MKITLSAKARLDLLETYYYLSERNFQAAEKFLGRFNASLENLSHFPSIGRKRQSIAPGIRSLVVGVHLLLYAIKEDEIVIVRVIDGRMDIDKEFRR